MAFLVVPNDLFKQMQSYKTLECNQKERQNMKYTFLDRIKEKVSLRWNRAVKLLAVMDEIIYKATDRGFSFNGRETLAKKCKVGLSTVDKAISILKESDEVIIAYRHNPSSNGYKTPIIILKNHPHYQYWNELLGLEQEVEQKVESQENADTPKVEGTKKVYTYHLPFSKNSIYSYIDDMRTSSTVHNEQSINLIINNLKQATSNELSSRSFKTVVRRVINKYNEGEVGNFRSYLVTAISNKIAELELRRTKDKAQREIQQSKHQRPEVYMSDRAVPLYNWLEA